MTVIVIKIIIIGLYKTFRGIFPQIGDTANIFFFIQPFGVEKTIGKNNNNNNNTTTDTRTTCADRLHSPDTKRKKKTINKIRD